MTQLQGHGLVGEGAAHNDDGERTQWNITAGPGRAKCACGWLSEPAKSGSERKRMHRFHKEFVRAAQDYAAFRARAVAPYGQVSDQARAEFRGVDQLSVRFVDDEPTYVIDRGE